MNLESFNRPICFRVYNKKTKQWLHGPHESSSLDGVNLLGETILLGAFCEGVSLEELNDLVVLQFTGLKDKNGKKIFEGDILRIPENDSELIGWHELVLVEYKYGAFGYKNYPSLKGGKFDILYQLIGESETDDCAEIVGNIFDTPELID